MRIRLVTGATVEPVTLAEAKDHLNFTSDDKDALIEAYISAARAFIEGQCHIVIAEALYEASFDGFPASPIEIGRFPMLSVDSIKYDDEDDVEQTLDVADYTVDTSGPFGRIIAGADGWPATNGLTNSVRIQFWSGFPIESGSSPSVLIVPQDLKQAILLMVGFFFANRDGSNAINEPPPAVEALISHYRIPVIA